MTMIVLLMMVVVSLWSAEGFNKVQHYTTGYNRFAAEVYKELLQLEKGNFIMCPLSANIILTLITNGAKEKNLNELSSALRILIPVYFADVHEIFETLISRLQRNAGNDYAFFSANKIYASYELEISEQFKNVATSVYKADIENIYFNDTRAAQEINRWVAEKTDFKIKDIIEQSSLSLTTLMVLVNTIYFRGRWDQEFSNTTTTKGFFSLNKTSCVETDIMRKTDIYNYYENLDLNAKFLKMPYKDDVSMHIVLPNDIEGLARLEARIDDILVFSKPQYSTNRVKVAFPKFDIESNIEFKPILKAMGVSEAFQDHANFRGIGTYKNKMFINQVKQKVRIDIDEEGTSAAAVTDNDVQIPQSGIFDVPTVTFHADRPFLFYIRLNKLDYNVFVGRYVGPQK